MSRAGLSTLYDPNWSILGQLLAHILCYVTPSTNVTVTDTLPVAIDGTDLNETVTVTAGQSVVFIIPATIKQNAGYSTTIINTAYYSHASDSSGDTVTFTTLADITPPAFITTPVLITPTGGITLSNQQSTFDWENAVDTQSGVVSYTLLISTSNNSISVQSAFTTVVTSQSIFTPTADLGSGVYTWTVRAHDAAGNSSSYVNPVATFSIEPGGDNSVYLPIVIKDN